MLNIGSSIVAIFSFLNVFTVLAASPNAGQCPSGWIYKDETPQDGFTYSDSTIIGSVGIKAGNECFEYADSGDECYQVIGIGTIAVSVSKIGTGVGQYCQDISHVVFYPQEGVSTSTPTPACHTPTPTNTPTPTPTNTPVPNPTNTPTPFLTNTPVPTNTPTPTCIPWPTCTPTLTNTPTPINTPTPTSTPVPEITPTFTPTPTNTPTPAPTNTPVPDPTNTPTPGEEEEGPTPTPEPAIGGEEPTPTNTIVAGIIETTQAKVLGETYNSIVDAIKESYRGSVLGSKIPQTSQTDFSQSKNPTGNMLIENSYIFIPSLQMNQSLFESQSIGGELLVGEQEILLSETENNTLIYGHNGTDVFGTLYKIKKGNSIFVKTPQRQGEYTVETIKWADKSDDSALETKPNQIALLTCSFDNPNLRIVVIAQKVE